MENTMVMSDMTRWASGPWKRSCTMARESTTLKPAAMPCSPRASISTLMLFAKMASTEAPAKSSSEAMTVGRRPKLSDSVPANSVVRAIMAM